MEITPGNVESTRFEQLVLLLREKTVIAATKACLQRLHLLSTFRHGSPSNAPAPENVNVRVFLAGFMIAYHPTHVFESMSNLEQALYNSAKALIPSFERICNSVLRFGDFQRVPRTETEQFPTQLFDYLKCFKAWKVPDEVKLTCRIKHALIALFQARQHLPPDEPADSKLLVEFDTQIDRLKSKLAQIAGQQVLTEFMAQCDSGRCWPVGDRATHGSGAYAALPGRMTNEALAHELLCDLRFQLDESGGCSVENPVFHRIRASFHQAFWDSLVDDLKLSSPCYARILRVLAEVRDGISDLAGSREAGSIAEVIDIDHITQQSEAGVYDWNNCMGIVGATVGVIQRIQAPSRDVETASKWVAVRASMVQADPMEQPGVFCKSLEFLLDRVNAMRIDAANARLRLIAPVIRDHGVDYERGKFQEKLDAGTLTIERTTAWIRRFVAPHLEQLSTGSAGAYIAVHSDAMLSLATSVDSIVSHEAAPETLLFDLGRLFQARSEYRGIVDGTSLILSVAHAMKGDLAIVNAVVELFVEPKCDMEGAPARVYDMVKQLSSVVPAGLEKTLATCVDPADAVNRIVANRVSTLLRSIMTSGGTPTVSSDYILRARKLVPRIEALGSKIYALAKLNRTVHTPTYNRIIDEAVADVRVAVVV